MSKKVRRLRRLIKGVFAIIAAVVTLPYTVWYVSKHGKYGLVEVVVTDHDDGTETRYMWTPLIANLAYWAFGN